MSFKGLEDGVWSLLLEHQPSPLNDICHSLANRPGKFVVGCTLMNYNCKLGGRRFFLLLMQNEIRDASPFHVSTECNLNKSQEIQLHLARCGL